MTRIPPWAVHTGGGYLVPPTPPRSFWFLYAPEALDEANLRRYPSMPQTEAHPYPRGCVLHVGTR
jgi:hypothetical protein